MSRWDLLPSQSRDQVIPNHSVVHTESPVDPFTTHDAGDQSQWLPFQKHGIRTKPDDRTKHERNPEVLI